MVALNNFIWDRILSAVNKNRKKLEPVSVIHQLGLEIHCCIHIPVPKYKHVNNYSFVNILIEWACLIGGVYL